MSLKSIYDKALLSLVRIRTITEAGSATNGTAFVYEYVTDDNAFPFLVTARSLVEDSAEGRIALMQAKGKEPLLGKGYTLDIDQFSKLWYAHPDPQQAVAVTPFVPFVRHVENTGTRIFFNAFTADDGIAASFYDNADLGQRVSLVGYPSGYWDRKQLLAVSKEAGIASIPTLDYNERHQLLLDMPMQSGWLGAPVLVREGKKIKLMGLLTSGGVSDDQDLDHTIVDPGSMSVMLKLDSVLETIRAYLREKGFI
ncbi:MAG: hypothetical protein OEZ43_14945 [Gammaproteobacteria bacterium]|nr:hypothetical protein [Gammaproteobacteria bacterium]